MKIIFTILSLVIVLRTSAQVPMKKYSPCYFSVSLPKTFKLKKEDDAGCDYIASFNGRNYITLHSLESGRFMFTDIQQLYDTALKVENMNIVYKTIGKNWFVLSGTDPKTGEYIYWKRLVTENFVSDITFKYPASRKQEIEPYISAIVRSFTSQ